jgi:1-acyl-sn-glycerol-3-phosphate acyltransferase
MNLQVPEYHRAGRNRFNQWLGRTILRWGGWQVIGDIPQQNKMILAVGPHTSNWDFIIAMATILALDINIHWMAKHSIFRFPFKRLFLTLGGLPVDRSQPRGVAETIAHQINASDAMIVALMPEGTRSRVEKLKTGFLRIARATPCQVLPITLDFVKREIKLHSLMTPGEDLDADCRRVRQLFATATPKHPEKF